MTEPSTSPATEASTPATPVASAPVATPAPDATAPATAAPSAPPSPAVLALGFIIMALLGALLFVSFQSKSTPAAESQAEVAARIKKDTETLLSLNGHTQNDLSQKDALLLAKETELRDSERTKNALLTQCASLKSDLDRALANGSSGDLYKTQLADATKRLDILSADLSKARAQLADYAGRPSGDDIADLQRRLDEATRAKSFFETRVKELEMKLNTNDDSELQHLREEIANLRSQLAPKKLFASSEQELAPLGIELYHGLQKLETLNDAEIRLAYDGFRGTLGAKVVKNLSFPTGSATPSPSDDDAARAAVRALPDDGLLLVVGYASKTGNADDNRKLSSERATAVAKSLDSAKLPNQKVQAVYLGSTERFGRNEPENNQLCEIWQIRSRN